MRLLVLGGSGFISRYVVQGALAQGDEVFYVTRGNRTPIPGAAALIADRNDPGTLQEVIRSAGGRFDAVLDCICFTAEQARLDNAILPEFSDRLIVVSTDSVYYPNGKRVPQDENGAAYMQDDSYGGRKRAMELAISQECPMKWTMFRPPHMYGPGSELGCFPVHTRQKDLLEHLRQGKPIQLVGGGEYKIQPLYAGDLAQAMLASIRNEKTYDQIFCIAGPDAIPNRKYFEILGEILNLPVSIEAVDTAEYRSRHEDSYLYLLDRVYDLSKLKNAGLPVPKVGLREGLTKQAAWLIQQGR